MTDPLRAAAQAVSDHAYVDFLVPAEAIDALRDALAADTARPDRCAPYGNPHPNGQPCPDCIAYGYTARPDPVCSCGPWEMGQPQGHLTGCPRAAETARPGLDVEAVITRFASERRLQWSDDDIARLAARLTEGGEQS